MSNYKTKPGPRTTVRFCVSAFVFGACLVFGLTKPVMSRISQDNYASLREFNAPAKGTADPPSRVYVLDTNGTSDKTQILLSDLTHGKVIRTFPAGYMPDMALSPDGSRLYVISGLTNPSGSGFTPFLVTYDTTSGLSLGRVELPDLETHQRSIYPTRMAISSSGNLLYVVGNRYSQDSEGYYLLVFDTVANTILPNRVPLGNCSGFLLPVQNEEAIVDFACMGTAQSNVREITVGNASDLPSVKWLMKRANPKSTGIVFMKPGDKQLGFIDGGGTGLSIDRSAAQVQNLGKKLDISGWIESQKGLVSPDGTAVFFGAAKSRHANATDSYDQIVKADPVTLSTGATLTTTLPFYSMAVSRDGSTLYTVSPGQATITVIDANSLQEIRQVNHMGKTPIRVIVAP